MSFEMSPVPHVDMTDGFTVQELVVNGLLWFVVLVAAFAVLVGLLHLIGAFREGFNRGLRG